MFKDEVCCWACSKCEDYEYLINEIACMDCGLGHWPTTDRKACFDLSINHLKYMRWNTWHSLIPSMLAIVGMCATIAVITVYIM